MARLLFMAILILLFLSLGNLANPGRAFAAKAKFSDKIFLKNGDRISGRVLSVERDILVIRTPYAGTLRIARTSVKKIVPPLSLRITLKTGEVVDGDTHTFSQNSISLSLNEESRNIPNEQIWGLEIKGREKSPWSGNIAAGMGLTQGNSDIFSLNIQGALLRETARKQFRFKGSQVFKRSDGSTDANRADGEVKFAYFRDPIWFSFIRERLETDADADVDIRSDSTFGLGARVIDRKAMRLEFELGPGYGFTRFDGGDREEAVTGRIGAYLRTFFWKIIKFEFEPEFIQSFDDGDNFLIRADASLTFPIQEKLNFVLSVKERFDNTPAEGHERNDLSVFSNLQYMFP